MPRRLSCSMTLDAVRERRKTETRRDPDTWKDLKPGDLLVLIEKGMGLPKGAKQRVLTTVVVTENEVEPLGLIDDEGVAREGFPDMDRVDFMFFWLRSHGRRPEGMSWAEIESTLCRRIEWRYLDDEAATDG